MPRVRKLEASKEIIADAYMKGASMADLGSTYGVSEGTIRNILRRLNVTLRKQGRRSK